MAEDKFSLVRLPVNVRPVDKELLTYLAKLDDPECKAGAFVRRRLVAFLEEWKKGNPTEYQDFLAWQREQSTKNGKAVRS